MASYRILFDQNFNQDPYGEGSLLISPLNFIFRTINPLYKDDKVKKQIDDVFNDISRLCTECDNIYHVYLLLAINIGMVITLIYLFS